MTKNRANTEVDLYLANLKNWRAETEKLRTILLACQLTEELKWRKPCYTFQNSNVALIGGFKEYCALTFFKGVFLEDASDILKKPGENTQTARLIRFTNLQEIVEMEPILKDYVREAIDVEKAGLKVEPRKTLKLALPDELQSRLDESPALKKAFDALTPGRQRGYVLHFSGAKQSKTRASRIEKHVERILDGKGLNDCTCGLSQKLPYCDGSHKQLRK